MLTNSDLLKIGHVVERKLEPIRRDLKKIHKELEFAIGVLDRDRVDLAKRFDDHLTELHHT